MNLVGKYKNGKCLESEVCGSLNCKKSEIFLKLLASTHTHPRMYGWTFTNLQWNFTNLQSILRFEHFIGKIRFPMSEYLSDNYEQVLKVTQKYKLD